MFAWDDTRCDEARAAFTTDYDYMSDSDLDDDDEEPDTGVSAESGTTGAQMAQADEQSASKHSQEVPVVDRGNDPETTKPKYMESKDGEALPDETTRATCTSSNALSEVCASQVVQ